MNISNLLEERTFIYQTLDPFKNRLDELLSPLMQKVALVAIAVFVSIAVLAIYRCCFSRKKKQEDKTVVMIPKTVYGFSTDTSKGAIVFPVGSSRTGATEAENKRDVLSSTSQSTSTPFNIRTHSSILEKSDSPSSDSPVDVTPIHPKPKIPVTSNTQKTTLY